MYMIRLLSSVFVVTCFLIHTHCADNYTDQNRPYEFGFKIDGQQHRHEKKDKNGIIMGEFGFITADDVYHVTVYATDEQGRFKILSMKNIHLKNTKSVTSVRQGHSLQIPSTHQASAVQVTTTTNQPIRIITQESEPISLEPPVNSCSHCSIPTTSTTAPKSLLSINQANSYNTLENRIGSKVAPKTRSQVSSVEFNSLSPNAAIQQNSFPSLQSAIKLNQPNYAKGLGLQANSPSIANEREGFPQSLEPAQNYPTQTINRQNQNHPSVNSPSVYGTQQYNTPQEINEGQSYVQAPESKQRFSTVGAPGEQDAQKNTLPQTNAGQLNYRPASGDQRYLSQEQNYATISRIQQISTPQEINGGQNYVKAPNGQNFVQKTQQNDFAEKTYSRLNYPQGVGTQQNYQPSSASYQPSNPKKNLDVLQPTIEQINSFKSPQSSPQAAVTSNVRSFGTNGQSNELSKNKNIHSQTIKQFVGQTPGEFSPGGNIPEIRTPKQLNGGEAVPGLKSQKPTLAYAQMQIVDKNTNIHTKAPGEKEGLPQGLTKDDMVRLLYTFNYTLGFQGHFEEGYSNGVKQGYYFVTGRNGVRTRIDYTADDKGFHPKISQDVLDLLSDDVPKPETEKQAKYGLKGYEFKWLYYPQD